MSLVRANFNGTGKRWTQGDYNYDGHVDLTDFTFLAGNFNYTMPSDAAATGTFVSSIGTPTPEPAGLSVLLAAAAMLRRRRRR